MAGFLTHVLYQRWNPASEIQQSITNADISAPTNDGASAIHRVSFVPFAAVPEDTLADLPLLAAREVEKIRGLTGRQARIRGRVFRVGHSAKSNTFFLNFGPSREALTAVIFSSGVELFEKSKLAPKNFENKEIEVTGEIKDHPQFGLEIIIENPKQIKIMN